MGDIENGFRFGDWQAFPSRNLLRGRDGEVRLEPKVMRVLECLASHAGQVVERDALLESVWEGRSFSDEPLSRCIFELRRALGDSRSDPTYIETIPKRGYRLIAPVEPLSQEAVAAAEAGAANAGRRFTPAAVLGFGALVALVLIGLVMFENFRAPPGASVPEIEVQSPQVVGITTRKDASVYSIAVLPFANFSSDPEQEYFSDGLSEEILNLLAKVPSLKVIGRSSSFAFKGKNEDLRDIGEALGVKTVLEGSVRRSGDRLRITAQLIDVADGSEIWSESYDRTMTDVFAIQDDVAAAIIEALQMHVGVAPPRRHPTDNMEAYARYLQARALFVDETDVAGSEEVLLEALELDPEFAEAYELQARIYWNYHDQARAMNAAERALGINPDLVLAEAVFRQARDGTHLAGIEAFEQAVKRQPNDPLLLQALIWNLTQVGYFEDALVLAQRWTDIDPLSYWAYKTLANVQFAVGRPDDANTSLDIWSRLSGRNPAWMRGAQSLLDGRYENAIAYFEDYLESRDHPDASWVRELVTEAADGSATYNDLRRQIVIRESGPDVAATHQIDFTIWYLAFGFLDEYFDELLTRDPNDLRWAMADIWLYNGMSNWRSGFTAHPRFLEVAESMGLTKIWDKRGPPNMCEKIGDQWVCV